MRNKKDRKIIKLSAEQLNEAIGYEFDADNETPQFDWSISSTGKVEPTQYGQPTTTDKVGKSLATSRYWWYTSNWKGNTYRDLYDNLYENMSPTTTTTNTAQMKQQNKTNGQAEKMLAAADYATNGKVDILSNNDPTDDLVAASATAEDKAEKLIDQLEKNPNPKVQATILNKIIERCNLKSLPMWWKKRLIAAIGMSDNRGD